MVAMSGAIMPAPLAMPLIVTSTSPIFALAVATLGKVSVVMIALAASSQPSGRALRRQLVQHALEFAGVERFADHPGRGHENLVLVGADRLGGELRDVSSAASRPALAGEGVGVAGIDHQAARAAAAEVLAAPVDRRGRAFGRGEHARDRRAFIENNQQHIGAALVANAGGAGGEAHAVESRKLGEGLRREGGNRSSGGHGMVPSDLRRAD